MKQNFNYEWPSCCTGLDFKL